MFMYDAADTASIMGRSAYQLPEIKGRAMIKMKDVHIAQLYLPVPYEDEVTYVRLIGEVIENINQNNTAPKAVGIRIVPEVVRFEDILPYAQTTKPITMQAGESAGNWSNLSTLSSNPRTAVLGFNTETTEPEYLDLSIASHLVVGSPASGKTNILRILIRQFLSQDSDRGQGYEKGLEQSQSSPMFIVDSRAGDLHQYEALPGVTYMDNDNQLDNFYENLTKEVGTRQQQLEQSGMRSKEFCATIPTAFIIIDDGDNFVELCRTKEMDIQNLLSKSRDVGFAIITTTLPSKLRGYDGITALLKDNQSGIVLGNPSDQGIFQITQPRGFKPVAEIGFWYKRGDVRQIKIPFVT